VRRRMSIFRRPHGYLYLRRPKERGYVPSSLGSLGAGIHAVCG